MALRTRTLGVTYRVCYFDVDIGDNGHISVDELTALQEAHDTIGRIQDMAKEKSPLTQLMKPTNPPK